MSLEADGVIAAGILEGWADHLASVLSAGGLDGDEVRLAEAEVDSCRRVAFVLRAVAEDPAT